MRAVRRQLWARGIELDAGKGQVVSATCTVVREYGARAGVKPIEWQARKGDGEPGSVQTMMGMID